MTDETERTDYPEWGDYSEPTALEEAAWWLGAGIAALILAGIVTWGVWRVWFYFFGG
jgi:hypothetical protein